MVKEIMNLSPVQSRAIARHVPFQYISFLSYILSIQVFFYSSFERTKENVRATVQITTVIMGRLFYVMDSFLMAHGGAWSVSGCKFVTSKTLTRFWLFRLTDEICHRRLSIIRFWSCRQWFVPKSQIAGVMTVPTISSRYSSKATTCMRRHIYSSKKIFRGPLFQLILMV